MMELREISASTLANNLRLSVACLCLVAAAATPAFAFRPFDGTDAAVVDPGKMETELQPAGRLHDDSGKAQEDNSLELQARLSFWTRVLRATEAAEKAT